MSREYRHIYSWFITENSRLQGEVSYASGDVDGGDSDDQDIIELGVRYDTMLAFPIVAGANVSGADPGSTAAPERIRFVCKYS